MTYRHGNTFRAHSQFLRAAAQHDNASPPEDPVWDEYDAMANVADKLHASRDVAEVLGDLADAAQTLAWMAERVDLAGAAAGRFRLLLMHAERLKKMRDDELDALNGENMP
jgi:hypothetical protein